VVSVAHSRQNILEYDVRKITMEQFIGESHLVVSSPGRVEQSFEDFLKARKLKRRIVMSVLPRSDKDPSEPEIRTGSAARRRAMVA
jgi:hypothetical protein